MSVSDSAITNDRPKTNDQSARHAHSVFGLVDENFRRLSPVYLTLLFWNIAWSISITGPILPLYMKAIGVNIVGWSILAATFAVGMLLFEWIWGSLSDRIERPLLMISSMLCTSILYVLYTYHGSFVFFLVLQLFSGAVGVVIGPTTRAYVSEGSPQKSIGLYASLWWAFSSLGYIIGPLVGTEIAQTWSFEYSFYVSSVLSIILAFIILKFFPHDHKKNAGSPRGITHGAKTVLRHRSAGFLFLSTVFAVMSFWVVRSFLPLYASQEVGMSTVAVGALIAVISAAQLIATPFVGWLSDRFGRKRTAIVGFTLSACSFLLYFLAHNTNQVFLVSITVGLGLSVTSMLLAIIREVTPTGMYGTAVGIYGSFEDIGIIIGPLIYGFVWNFSGPVYIFAASATTQILSAILVVAIQQKQRPNG